jgi:hypothetical protein
MIATNTMNPCYERPEHVGDGQFTFVKNKHDREMMQNAFQAITLTKMWKFVANKEQLFGSSQNIFVISNMMEKLGFGGHSGCSYWTTMKNMHYLAVHGDEKFKKEFEKNSELELLEAKQQLQRNALERKRQLERKHQLERQELERQQLEEAI